jgi:prolyl 4-hydroxylase
MNSDFPVKILENYLSATDCAYLIQKYKDNVTASTVVDPANGTQFYKDPSRSSSSFFLPNSDPVVAALRKKIAEMLGCPEENFEGFQFLCYKKGERYNWHHDYFKDPALPYQRLHTILIYLNELSINDGGATGFWHYNIKVYPKTGRAVYFRNAHDDGTVIPETMHSGEEILTDVTKYALNIWVRNKKF